MKHVSLLESKAENSQERDDLLTQLNCKYKSKFFILIFKQV